MTHRNSVSGILKAEKNARSNIHTQLFLTNALDKLPFWGKQNTPQCIPIHSKTHVLYIQLDGKYHYLLFEI